MRRPYGTPPLLVLACLAIASAAAMVAGPLFSAAAGAAVRGHAQARSRTSDSMGTNGLQSMTVTAAGRQRTYLLYVPPSDSANDRLPLVLAYNGASGTAQSLASGTNLLNDDEQHQDMILAFMQGYDDTWDDDDGETPAEEANVNDVAFTTAVLAQVESSYYVDMKHVVVTGISNGAILDELLGCRAAANLTLIVPVEGQIGGRFSAGCRPSDPISVYEIHATADPDIPYNGGTFDGDGGPVTVLSAPASARRWAQLDKCRSKPSRTVSSGAAGVTVLTRYKGCGDGVAVTLETIEGGSHDWPANFATTLARVIASTSGKRRAMKP